MKKLVLTVLALSVFAFPQQTTQEKAAQPKKAAAKAQPAPEAKEAPAAPAPPEPAPAEAPAKPSGKDEEPAQGVEPNLRDVPPVVTQHEIRIHGKTLKYTATAGRMPLRDNAGNITALVFYVAYTVDTGTPATRPLTFAFNGGPGSASLWLHMGALGPRRVVMQPDGWMPASPYRMVDNDYTIIDKTDLVMMDAIGTGFSRARDEKTLKHYLGVKGDVEAAGEFMRMYITRNERWTSPLYILGESYGTTRAAGVSGYLIRKGISFNGIILLSSAVDLGTLENTRGNDLPFVLLIPTYSMIAAYHHKLAPELTQDLGRLRSEVTQWASTTYASALAKGDSISPEERQSVIEQMARYTGLDKKLLDNANLRIDVQKFTHNLLLDQKLRVGRLDGRFTGPDPEGLLDTPFYDPSGAQPLPPFASVLNNYVRTELGYKTDAPYYIFGGEKFFDNWDWGKGIDGFPSTAGGLREAMTIDPYLKVLLMEGYYDLATPFYAADYTVDHLDLPANLRKNLSTVHYDSGHMVYLRHESLVQFKSDIDQFIEGTQAPATPAP